jgi:hypothetical protein
MVDELPLARAFGGTLVSGLSDLWLTRKHGVGFFALRA